MLYKGGEVNYSKTPHIRTYSYGLSLKRFLLAIHNLAKCTVKLKLNYSKVLNEDFEWVLGGRMEKPRDRNQPVGRASGTPALDTMPLSS